MTMMSTEGLEAASASAEGKGLREGKSAGAEFPGADERCTIECSTMEALRATKGMRKTLAERPQPMMPTYAEFLGG